MILLRRLHLAPLAAALFLIAPRMAAQSLTSGGIEGVVRDSVGAPIAGALVTVSDDAGGSPISANADPGGDFGFRPLAPGMYAVLVERIGYRPRRVAGVPVRAGASTRVEVTIARVAGAADRVDSLAFAAGSEGGFGGPDRMRLSAADLAGLPVDRRELGQAARFSTLLASASAGFEPGLTIDGVRFTPVRLPAGVRDPLGTAAFAFRWLDQAQVVSAPADVEWTGGAGSYLHAFTRRGARTFGLGAEGAWSGGSLATSEGFPSASVSHSGFEGGALAAGPLGGGSGGFAFGAEVRRLETPLQLSSRVGDLATQLATFAHDSFGVTLNAAPQIVRTDLGSAFARFDGRLAPGSTLSFTAAGSTLLTPEQQAPGFLGGGGGSGKGSDGFASATLASRISDEAGAEVRATFASSTRQFAAGADSAAGLPSTRIVSGGLGFGAGEDFPGRFSRVAGGGTATLFYHTGTHLFKLGGGAELAHHDRAYAPAAAGQFTFSDAADFVRGRGTFVQTVGALPSAAFSLPRFSAFAQDTWTPAPGVELVLGSRFDLERLPVGSLSVDTAWALRSGMINAAVHRSSRRFEPRASLTVDPGATHQWLFRAEGGVYTGESDPALLAEAVGGRSSLRVRRGIDVRWSASRQPDSAAVSSVGRTLSILSPEWAPPRTARAEATLTRALPGGAAIHFSGGWRRTDFLPRRSDLNRLPDPTGRDQYDRPLFGTLVQRGSLLLAQPGSNRRFTDFDRVSALDVDGWLTWTGATVELERRPAAGLGFLASYTVSRTRDNLPSADGFGAGDLPSPFAKGTGADWTEGRSGFDVPQRLVAVGEWRGGGARTPSLAVVYRYRSGDPFTPGFRAGVDANGDGSADNDPAFVDPAVSGFSALSSAWACLGAQSRGFAARNSCRGPAVQALDVRVGMDVLRGGAHAARLTVDGLNLLGGDAGPVDAALFLVDPTRTLTTDAQGRTVVPLVANPGFGKPLLRSGTGRTLRVSLQLTY